MNKEDFIERLTDARVRRQAPVGAFDSGGLNLCVRECQACDEEADDNTKHEHILNP